MWLEGILENLSEQAEELKIDFYDDFRKQICSSFLKGDNRYQDLGNFRRMLMQEGGTKIRFYRGFCPENMIDGSKTSPVW